MAQHEGRLLRTIVDIQNLYLSTDDPRQLFDKILSRLIRYSWSENGFIGEVLRKPDGAPYLKTYALTNIAWNDETRKFYEENAPQGLEFHNLDTLFGWVLKNGQALLTNEPANDLRKGGLPPGHPPINSFLGVPLFHRGELVGMVGIANRKKGYSAELLLEMKPLLDFVGGIVALVRSRRVQAALDAEREGALENLKSVTENFQDVIWMLDPVAKTMLFINPAYERIWEKTCQSLLDVRMSFLDAIHPEDRARVVAAMPKQAFGHYNETYRLLMPDGRVKWVQARAFPIPGKSGEAVRIVGIATEITDRVEAERVIDNQRMALVQSAKLSSLGEMAGSIAHEINNPLSIIQGKAEQLRTRLSSGNISPEQVIEGLQTVEKTAQRISKIIRGLRTFARSGEGDPLESVAVSRIVEDAISLCGERFRNHGVSLRVSTDLDSTILCRPVQISQALLNLLSNAFDAAVSLPDPWVEVRSDSAGEIERITVTDCGSGIPPEVAARLMEPFFTTKGVGKGTGLGLSITKGIVDLHGGRFFLDAGHPHTRFVIELPRGEPSEQVEEI